MATFSQRMAQKRQQAGSSGNSGGFGSQRMPPQSNNQQQRPPMNQNRFGPPGGNSQRQQRPPQQDSRFGPPQNQAPRQQPQQRPPQRQQQPQPQRGPPQRAPQQSQQPQQPQRRAQPIKKRRPMAKPLISKIHAVQIEGLVLLKIIKHCGEYLARKQAVSGKLLGLPTEQHTVEVTNCFPEPSRAANFGGAQKEAQTEEAKKRAHKKSALFAQDMVRLMTRIREDNRIVGFYRSALDGEFLSSSTIEAQYRHQLQSPSSVCIIYDPTASVKGRLVIRAFQLSEAFMTFYAKNDFGVTSVTKANLAANGILEELDIKIHNSHLVHAFLYDIAQMPPSKALTDGSSRLHHSHQDSLVTNLKQLSGAVDAYADNTQQFRAYYSKSSRNKAKKDEFIQKLQEENRELRAQGRKPKQMPDVDKMFPAEDEPDRIDSITVTAQMNEYCEEVETSIMQGLVKLWVSQGIHAANVIQ